MTSGEKNPMHIISHIKDPESRVEDDIFSGFPRDYQGSGSCLRLTRDNDVRQDGSETSTGAGMTSTDEFLNKKICTCSYFI